MAQKLLMGNEAIALGAIRAGVDIVTGYPGTPSSEVLETIAKYRNENTYVEWSVNEKSRTGSSRRRSVYRRPDPGHDETGRFKCGQ